MAIKTGSSSLRIVAIQHVAFEQPARFADWTRRRGHDLHSCHPYRGEPLPSVDDFDCLIVLGGPMGIGDQALYPWLNDEQRLIGEVIEREKIVVGVCLGAQLIADLLGARVSRNPQPEVGWFPVTLTAAGRHSPLFAGEDHQFTALHWHQDRFSIPDGCSNLASSQFCKNQAFQYGNHVLGMQFHIECDEAAVKRLLRDAYNDWPAADSVQSAAMIRRLATSDSPPQALLDQLMDRLTQ